MIRRLDDKFRMAIDRLLNDNVWEGVIALNLWEFPYARALPEDKRELSRLVSARGKTVADTLREIHKISTRASDLIRMYNDEIQHISDRFDIEMERRKRREKEFCSSVTDIASPFVDTIRSRVGPIIDDVHILTSIDKIGKGIAGVYIMFDEDGVYYVGRSINVKNRMKNHRRNPLLPEIYGIIIVVTEDLSEVKRNLICGLRPAINGRVPDTDLYKDDVYD